jgi:hypothetical protein
MKTLIIIPILLFSLFLGLPSYSSDFDKGLTAYKNGDYATALKEWKPLAEQGDVDAQYHLGVMYDNGDGVSQDYKEAVRWYTLAAEQGDVDAQYSLGVMYDNGDGVSQDYKEAARWYTLAAEQGVAEAQYNLGYMYYNGQGGPVDYKEAVRWYTLAAEQGDVDAQYNLGVIYGNGDGVPQDYKEAVRWYTLAAKQGDVDAQHNLDLIHREGLGVPQDDEEAVWFDNQFTKNLVITGLFAMLGGSYMVYRYNFKDISSLPEIKLLNNEEIIFSNYKIVAFDEGHTIWNQKLAFYYCTLTNKAFYILPHSKYQPKVGLSGRMKSNTQIFDEMVWKRISYEQSEIKFGKISPYRYVELIHKKEKYSVRIQLTALFNKQARQIGNYIKDELKHLVIKS